MTLVALGTSRVSYCCTDNHIHLFLKLFQNKVSPSTSPPKGACRGTGTCRVPCRELHARPRRAIHFTAKTPGEDNRRECSCLCHPHGFVWAAFNEAQQFTTALPLSLRRKLCRAASPLPLISFLQEPEPHSSTAARAWRGEEGAPSPGLLWGTGT